MLYSHIWRQVLQTDYGSNLIRISTQNLQKTHLMPQYFNVTYVLVGLWTCWLKILKRWRIVSVRTDCHRL